MVNFHGSNFRIRAHLFIPECILWYFFPFSYLNPKCKIPTIIWVTEESEFISVLNEWMQGIFSWIQSFQLSNFPFSKISLNLLEIVRFDWSSKSSCVSEVWCQNLNSIRFLEDFQERILRWGLHSLLKSTKPEINSDQKNCMICAI